MVAEENDLKTRLADSRRRLLRVIEGVTEEQFRKRPSPEDWSMSEVLSHLLWSERLWAERIALALANDGASYEPTPPDQQDEGARAGRRAPVPQLVHGLLGVRREVEQLVERAGSTPGGFERAVAGPRGRRTIASMLTEQVLAHELEHVAQLETLREAAGVTRAPATPRAGTSA
jgi:hypothetical protein